MTELLHSNLFSVPRPLKNLAKRPVAVTERELADNIG